MIRKSDFHAIAKKVLRHQRGVHEQQLIHPNRDWFIGILVSVLLVAGIGYGAVTMYFEISTRSVTVSSNQTTEVTVYRGELVDAARERFGERAATYRELLENRITTPAPLPEVATTTEVQSDIENPDDSEEESQESTDAEPDNQEAVREGAVLEAF